MQTRASLNLERKIVLRAKQLPIKMFKQNKCKKKDALEVDLNTQITPN